MRVLSIDGGGIRGLIPATVCAEIERRCDRPIAELFDLIAGTSTGGILTCALACPGADGRPAHSAEDLIGIYTTNGPKIFHRSLLRRITSIDGVVDERYSNEALKETLREHLGDTRLKDVVCDVFVTGYELRLRQEFFFRSARARGQDLPGGASADAYDFALRDVALATAAAPTYFEPAQIEAASGERYALVDGGVFANNPAMCAYAETRRGQAAEELLVVSLGTGTQPPAHGIDPDAASGWGALQWARPLLDILFDGVADTVDFELGQLAGVGYVRLQRPLQYAREAMDDASSENLENLRRDADELVADSGAQLDAICARLGAAA